MLCLLFSRNNFEQILIQKNLYAVKKSMNDVTIRVSLANAVLYQRLRDFVFAAKSSKFEMSLKVYCNSEMLNVSFIIA